MMAGTVLCIKNEWTDRTRAIESVAKDTLLQTRIVIRNPWVLVTGHIKTFLNKWTLPLTVGVLGVAPPGAPVMPILRTRSATWLRSPSCQHLGFPRKSRVANQIMNDNAPLTMQLKKGMHGSCDQRLGTFLGHQRSIKNT